jgi:hypothetical protein
MLKDNLQPLEHFDIVSAKEWTEISRQGFNTSPSVPLFILKNSLSASILASVV